MNASKAKRRWIKWCRYVDKTQSQTAARSHAGTHYGQAKAYGTHYGQAKAYRDAMCAGRWAPNGVRVVWYPRWGSVQ